MQAPVSYETPNFKKIAYLLRPFISKSGYSIKPEWINGIAQSPAWDEDVEMRIIEWFIIIMSSLTYQLLFIAPLLAFVTYLTFVAKRRVRRYSMILQLPIFSVLSLKMHFSYRFVIGLIKNFDRSGIFIDSMRVPCSELRTYYSPIIVALETFVTICLIELFILEFVCKWKFFSKILKALSWVSIGLMLVGFLSYCLLSLAVIDSMDIVLTLFEITFFILTEVPLNLCGLYILISVVKYLVIPLGSFVKYLIMQEVMDIYESFNGR